ncbi:MAG: hypothetical protein IJ636_08390 [Bacteroidales bacterium]|nr:hypothetical protein [Bacteroidales bacterium]
MHLPRVRDDFHYKTEDAAVSDGFSGGIVDLDTKALFRILQGIEDKGALFNPATVQRRCDIE